MKIKQLAVTTGATITLVVFVALATMMTAAGFERLTDYKAQRRAAAIQAEGERALMQASANVTQMLGEEAAAALHSDRAAAHPLQTIMPLYVVLNGVQFVALVVALAMWYSERKHAVKVDEALVKRIMEDYKNGGVSGGHNNNSGV